MVIPHFVFDVLFYCFSAVVFTQVLYYVFFFIRFVIYKEKTPSIISQKPVSVVICAKNEANNLAKNLQGYLYQEYKTTHEIVVVNDNSEDESKYVIDEYKKEFKNLNVIELVQEAKLIPGKKFPLSMGIKSAKYETLLLTDADCIPASENWIDLIQAAYEPDTEIVLGYGAYYKKKGLLNKLIRFETFHTALQYFSYALAGYTYMGVGRNLSYKKEVFNRNKGFSSMNHLPSGDDDLFINKAATKTNVKIVVNKEAFTLSEPKKTFAEWYAQKTRHYSTAKYYKPITKFLLGTYNASFFLLYPLFITCLIFCNWWLVLSIFGVRLVLQGVVYTQAMNKLDEKDLRPWFWLFDIWMFIYQLIFLPTLFKKARNNW